MSGRHQNELRLRLSLTDSDAISLERDAASPGEHTFTLPDGETLRFELDATGKVTRMYRRSDWYVPVGDAKR